MITKTTMIRQIYVKSKQLGRSGHRDFLVTTWRILGVPVFISRSQIGN